VAAFVFYNFSFIKDLVDLSLVFFDLPACESNQGFFVLATGSCFTRKKTRNEERRMCQLPPVISCLFFIFKQSAVRNIAYNITYNWKIINFIMSYGHWHI